MGSDSRRAFGAIGRDDLLYFDPEDLVIVTDPKHPLFDERALDPVDEKTVLSIMQVGVLEPIIVRKNGEDENKKPIVEVVDGRGRTKAARVANHRLKELGRELVRIPGVRKRGDSGDLMGIMITANEIRNQDGPLVKAKKLQRYLDQGRTLDDASVAFGTTQATLKAYLSLLDCHPDVQKALQKGRIGITHAKKLSAFPQEEQPAQLEKLLAAPAAGEAAEGEEPLPLNDRLEKALNGRGKIRLRKLKTQKDIKAYKKRLEGSRAADAPIAVAILGWLLGDDSALDKFKALKNQAAGLDEEDA